VNRFKEKQNHRELMLIDTRRDRTAPSLRSRRLSLHFDGVGKLTPLGDPAPNAPKWFAAVEMIRLAADQDWLHKATKEIVKYWRHKRERRQSPLLS
jgi:hypothetical protein